MMVNYRRHLWISETGSVSSWQNYHPSGLVLFEIGKSGITLEYRNKDRFGLAKKQSFMVQFFCSFLKIRVYVRLIYSLCFYLFFNERN